MSEYWAETVAVESRVEWDRLASNLHTMAGYAEYCAALSRYLDDQAIA